MLTETDRAEVAKAVRYLDEIWRVQLQGVPSDLMLDELGRRDERLIIAYLRRRGMGVVRLPREGGDG